MKKKVLAVVTSAVLALGCFASASAANLEIKYDSKTKTLTAKTTATPSEKLPVDDGEAALMADIGAIYDAVNEGNMTINNKKANPAQKKALKAIKEGKIFSYENDSLDYSLSNDDYTIKGVQWNIWEKLTYLTHLYAQAGTEKVVRVFQITADEADSSNPVTVKIVDSDVKASKKYALRHLKDGVWDNTAGKVTSVVNGVVTAQLTDASPFALVELKASAPAEDANAAAKGATGTKTAPKTGEV